MRTANPGSNRTIIAKSGQRKVPGALQNARLYLAPSIRWYRHMAPPAVPDEPTRTDH